MIKVIVYFQPHATEEDILLLVRELEAHPITGGVAVVKEAAQQSVQLTGAWCPKCNLPPDEFGDCIRCGEPIAPATNA